MVTSKNKKQNELLSFNSTTLKATLVLNILINVAILFYIPYHFSFISAFILIPSLFGLGVRKRYMKTKDFLYGVLTGLLFSVLYATLAYYWMSLGSDGCPAFFGEYVPCFSSENLQYILLEIFFSPVVLLLIWKPLLKNLKIKSLFKG